MAADRSLTKRRIVEIKMGRSKFPGKPSKIGNRKRVNLSSCALPEDNDSSKAAKNIYLGLSVFNETFGDNEMVTHCPLLFSFKAEPVPLLLTGHEPETVAPGPFHGFSMAEVEEAMAEARLQQKEAEVEHKKQGININFWEEFQKELFSITSCSSYNNSITTVKTLDVNKTKLSFDGGGCTSKNSLSPSDKSNSLPSETVFKSTVLKGQKSKIYKPKHTLNTSGRKLNMPVKYSSPRLKLGKLQCGSKTSKSLQSQAAKKLLEKAKLSNFVENCKNSSDRKFILPSHSIHSSRVIKPNKKFFEDNENKRKLLRSKTTICASESVLKKHRSENTLESKNYTIKSLDDETKVNTEMEDVKRKVLKKNSEVQSSFSCKKNLQMSNHGKVILREARLQLDRINPSLLEGPFSSGSSSNLNQDNELKVKPVRSAATSGSIVCGVCGIVRFYRFVDLAKKFGIYCCESCKKFISKIIKSYNTKKNLKIQCLKGKGLCEIFPIVKNQQLTTGKSVSSFRCRACWLKLCLKNFNMPTKLKNRLLKLLPVKVQMNFLESPPISNDIKNKFLLANNIKDFKRIHENSNNSCEVKSSNKDNISEKHQYDSELSLSNNNKKCLRKRNRNLKNENALNTLEQKTKVEADEKNRQLILVKGPRVKHVCRSASVALGQPLATFSGEFSPTKKHNNESFDNCKNCDNLLATNSYIEPQGVLDKQSKEENLIETKQINVEKRISSSKQMVNSKVCGVVQQSSFNKSKRKINTKTENPVSMDFWESYDPEEICETGFGLIGSEQFNIRALCFLCGSSGQEKLIHCASCCEPYHEFCVDEGQIKLQDDLWKYDWICPRCTVCATCGRTSGQQLKCMKCDNSYHIECVDRVGGRLLHSPDRPWVCSVCLRCKSCNGVDVSIFVGNLPLCKACFVLRQKGNYCPLCQKCYEDDDYDSKMMECGQCKCWVHAKCEGLSDEKYQVLSFLPESVEFICRMCCVMPPAPWWIAVEAELKSGYLGVLKALSKNRKACTMLKWSPRKQCTCRQVNFVSRALDFEENKSSKPVHNFEKSPNDSDTLQIKEDTSPELNILNNKEKEEKCRPATISDRKASVEVINHSTGSLKLRLKISKGMESNDLEKLDRSEEVSNKNIKLNNKKNPLRVKKCSSNEENSEDLLTNAFESHEESQTSLQHSEFKRNGIGARVSEPPDKQSLSSPLNPPSDSGIGSTDDELKTNCLTDEEICKVDNQHNNMNSTNDIKSNCDSSASFLEEKQECFCFLEVDSYNSRSKPFSPNLMSIKKKVTTSEYSSLHQFHQDMQGMIATTQSIDLMELYNQTIKEIFPWFDPKFSRVQNNSQKLSGMRSLDSTPTKNSPTKSNRLGECKVPRDKFSEQHLDYFYSNYTVEDNRMCLMCKTIGDGPPGETGRLLYCGQNEWVHCNCALWSGEVFEEIDGSLQNVHSAISRGRSIRCPECNLKGASIGCCARNCQETYHFMCARKIGCTFMEDKTVYCPAHLKESCEKLVQNEKEFEIRRPVYVELDKRKMKSVDSSQIRFIVGALQVHNLGKFVMNLSDHPDAIIPEQFGCSRLFWSCYEPWRIVRYHFTVRLLEVENNEGIDFGINFTIDHSKEPELLELKLKQLKYFQDHNTLWDINEKLFEENIKNKRKLCDTKVFDEGHNTRCEDIVKAIPAKRPKKDAKSVKKILDLFDAKEDETCLSDNQNTADLLPPELEEAIFKDLPHDILDGISMQDIFMDIKNDPYESNTKEAMTEDSLENEDISVVISNKSKKNECHSDGSAVNNFWIDSNESQNEIKCNKGELNSDIVNQSEFWLDDGRQDVSDDLVSSIKQSRDLKKIKSDGGPNHNNKRFSTLKSNQKTCHFNWNSKTEGSSNKWKKNSKCHVTVNLLEPQERGNMLQELKFTDGLVTISSTTLDTVKDFKTHLDDSKCSMQQEEGKENKCLQWHTRLQPRLLQVDGNVDSSSSGSEAGESPQRLVEENIHSKMISAPQSSPFLDSPVYSIDSPIYPGTSSYEPSIDESLSLKTPSHDGICNNNYVDSNVQMNLPQLDGVSDCYKRSNESEDFHIKEKNFYKKLELNNSSNPNIYLKNINFKISQCDGGIDSESDDGDSLQCIRLDNITSSITTNHIKDEPVKCNKCHCTYRTSISYQRHLSTCNSSFILSSSEGEMSEDESPKKQINGFILNNKTEQKLQPDSEQKIYNKLSKKEVSNGLFTSVNETSCVGLMPAEQNLDTEEKLEVKKEKSNKRTYTRKKSVQNIKKPPVITTTQQVQQILVPQLNSVPSALIVQDITPPNLVPAAFIDSSTIGFVAAIDSQIPFGKPHMIATTNGLISGNIQFPSQPETQILGGVCLTPQTIQTNLPSFIIQQPQSQGTLISSQTGPVVVSGDQMMLGSTGLFELVQDPRTGGMYLASHNQPVFFNMETMVSNTVMQTNQFVSNVLATSFSQTSTQVFQTSKLEQIVNLPSNYIVVAPNSVTTDKIISSNDLICVQTPQTLLANQNQIQIPSQTLINAPLQPAHPLNTEPKIISTQVNSVRCLQPLQIKQICPPILMNKNGHPNSHVINQPVTTSFQAQESNPNHNFQNTKLKVKTASTSKTSGLNQFRSFPMMRPNVTKFPSKTYEKALITPKAKPQQAQPPSRALVDYINNFKSDTYDNFSSSPSKIQNNTSLQKNNNDLSLSLKSQKAVSTSEEPISDCTLNSMSSNIPKSLPSSENNQSSSNFSEVVNTLSQFSDMSTSKIECSSNMTEITSNLNEPTATTTSDKKLIDVSTVTDKTNTESDSVSQDSKKDLTYSCDSNKTSEVLTNKTNSLRFKEEEKLLLSMPLLENIPLSNPSVDSTEQLSLETSHKSENLTNEILPLQENSLSINTNIKNYPKSPQKVSPLLNKSFTLPFDEKVNHKKKSSSDQNSPGRKLPSVKVTQKKKEGFFSKIQNRKLFYPKKHKDKGPKLIFDVISDDGFKCSSTSMVELWANICGSVQEMRAVLKIPHIPLSRKGYEILGMRNHGLQYCLEQLKGVEQCMKYKCKYFLREKVQKEEDDDIIFTKENLSGCARTEKFTTRKEYDMFAWLASKHRQLPKLNESAEETLSSIRRANSLPMAMKYRNLKETAKFYVGVYRSKIHGRGLFCLREIEAGEMVIEYAGEVIRSNLTDKREKYYTDKGIGCYMFKIDDHFVVDATMKGNAARFINHSCEPNCYSRVVDILGKKHIVIFALRRINIMEELTYDYKFPFEDEKISCHCLSKKCRKYLN